MGLRSKNQPAGAVAPVGFLSAASRWAVEYTGLVTLVIVLLGAALCFAQWGLAYRHAQDWEANHPGQRVPFHLLAAAGRIFIIGAGSWFGLWQLSNRENKTASSLGRTDWWCFEMRKRQRIFEGRPMSRRLLWMHALFALLGFALGVALALRLAEAAAWQEPLLSRRELLLPVLAVLAILVAAFAAGRIRDVLFVLNCDEFNGERARQIAQAVAKEDQAEAEAEREYERKTITGLPYVILMGGLVAGAFLAYRWLPDADGTTAFQGIVSGLIGSAAAVYLVKLKPRGWRVWLGVALAGAAGFLVFTHLTWQRPPLFLLLGALWGTGVGFAATRLYLRQQRGS